MSPEEWPTLEFSALKPSILARFSTKTGEFVCGALIKEIVENVDRPTQLSSKILIENDQELEWIMQFINHAFNLPFYDDNTYGTLSAAVRIYLAWMTSLTTDPHKCCPEPLRAYPDKYFRKMIDSFRNIFIPKALSSPIDVEAELCRQGNEIRTILTAINHLTSSVQDDYKDEVWSRSLLFLMTVCDQLLSQTRTKDEIGCLMSADLSQALFDCWTKAALLEYIPSPSYWRTLSVLTWKWIPHVPVIEWWARKLLSLTVLMVQELYGISYCDITISDMHFMEAVRLQENKIIVKSVWLNMFQLIGNPVHCFKHAEALLSDLPLDASNLTHFSGRASLSFFLSVLAFSKIVDIYYGDSSVSIDFHECDELQAQWCDAISTLQDDKNSASHRSSNLSSSAVAVLENMHVLSLESAENQKLASTTSSSNSTNRKSLINITSFLDSQQQQASASGKNQGSYSRNASSSSNVINHSPKIPPISTHASAGQLVWYILRTNHLRTICRGNSDVGPSSAAMLELFLEWLFEAALISISPRDVNKYSEDFLSQKSLSVDAAGGALSNTTGTPSVQAHNLNSATGAGGNSTYTAAVAALSSSGQQQQQQHRQQSLPSPGVISVGAPPGSSTPFGGGKMYSRTGTQDEVINLGTSYLTSDSAARRSFAAQSTTSSNDNTPLTLEARQSNINTNINSIGGGGNFNNMMPGANVFDYPSVDGVVAGRAAALGSLCRIVCAKSTEERLADEQLAHFYLVLHEALIERDRLILCSLLYYSVDLYKLNLRGAEILLPNYLAAIDIVLTESMKLRLHPSIHQAEMRNACLRALGAIIAWPNVFGNGKILSTEVVSDSSSHGPRCGKSLRQLEVSLTYADLRQRMLRILLHILRNEIDAANLHLALGLCYVFCVGNAYYDMHKDNTKRNKAQFVENSEDEDSCKSLAVSALRGVVSAICDNLCKAHWNNDLVACLAALDCLNSLAALPHTILFHKNELSTGSLIVTSLCRFVDTQLQKPPMLHSRDLHSSIVLAYFTLANWISSAPMLTEIESCLSTLAQIIEFGMTGGKRMAPSEYKPASQRVCDAADYLLNTLFNLSKKAESSILSKSRYRCLKLDDEARLLQKFGTENIDLKKFKYFLINETCLIGLHEAQHINEISRGLPTVFAVIRTPYRIVHTIYFQLRPKVSLDDNFSADKENIIDAAAANAGTFSMTSSNATNSSVTGTATQADGRLKIQLLKSAADVDANFSSVEPVKQFVFPPGIHDVHCHLDAEFRPLECTPEVQSIIDQLDDMRQKLVRGSTGSDIRDAKNAWTQASISSLLAQMAKPEDCVKTCDSLRVFLYDMGLINRSAFGRTFIPLDSDDAPSDANFLEKLQSSVDRTPTSLLETVFIFYAKKGQRKADEILQNCENLEKTSPTFCHFLNGLGRGVDLSNGFAHWTGSWITAFTNKKPNTPFLSSLKDTNNGSSGYTLNGCRHFLYYETDQVEIAFLTPTKANVSFSANSKSLSRPLSKLTVSEHNANITTSSNSRNSDVSFSDASNSPWQPGGLPPVGGQKSSAWLNLPTPGGSAPNSEKMRGCSTEKLTKRSLDMRIFVVWLERIEDLYNFPFDEILACVDENICGSSVGAASARRSSNMQQPANFQQQNCLLRDFMIIYLCQVESNSKDGGGSGLVQIQTEGVWMRKYGQPLPLVDGMVVPAAVLPSLIQQTVCSVARRKMAEVENYQLNHIKRRQAILEFSRNTATKQTYSEFFERSINAKNKINNKNNN